MAWFASRALSQPAWRGEVGSTDAALGCSSSGEESILRLLPLLDDLPYSAKLDCSSWNLEYEDLCYS